MNTRNNISKLIVVSLVLVIALLISSNPSKAFADCANPGEACTTSAGFKGTCSEPDSNGNMTCVASTQTTDPGNTGAKTNPGNPGQPTDPNNPGQPTNPNNPGQPTDPNNPGQTTSPNSGIPNILSGAHINNLCDLINTILNIIAQLGAIVAVLFIIWSGFLFVTAQGNKTKLDQAKRTLYTTIIGTAILVGASVITKIIVDTVGSVTSAVSGNSGSAICASGGPGTGTSDSGSPTECQGVQNGTICMEGLGKCQNGICVTN